MAENYEEAGISPEVVGCAVVGAVVALGCAAPGLFQVLGGFFLEDDALPGFQWGLGFVMVLALVGAILGLFKRARTAARVAARAKAEGAARAQIPLANELVRALKDSSRLEGRLRARMQSINSRRRVRFEKLLGAAADFRNDQAHDQEERRGARPCAMSAMLVRCST